jgi:uncharacterized membrane protein YhhN
LSHVVIGGLLVLGAIAYHIVAIKSKQRWLIWGSVLGLLATAGAFTAGELFMETQNDGFSMLMAVSFLVALLTYVGLGFEIRRRK